MIAWLAMTVSFLVSFGSKMYWLLARDKPVGAFFPFRKQDWLGRQSWMARSHQIDNARTLARIYQQGNNYHAFLGLVLLVKFFYFCYCNTFFCI
jgi:hypothetical protein